MGDAHRHSDACGHQHTRRDFLTSASALGASLLISGGADAQTSTPIKPYRFDTHHHIYPTVYLDKHKGDKQPIPGLGRPGPVLPSIQNWSPQVALDEMDQNKVQTAITSVVAADLWNPADIPGSRQMVRACNEYSAKLMQDHPTRFGMFAVVTPPDVEGSLKEIEYAFDTLKADGVIMLTSYGNQWPGDRAFAPIFDEINRRKGIVYFHPTNPACCSALFSDIGAGLSEFTFDTTRAIQSLLYYGTFSRCTDTRFIFSHGGGVVAMIAGRWDVVGAMTRKATPNSGLDIPESVFPILARHYYDMADVANPVAYAALSRLVGIDKILFGSDYPWLFMKWTLDGMSTLKLSDKDRRAIERENALALFPRFKTA